MNIKEKAKEFAIKAHKGQVRKNEKDNPVSPTLSHLSEWYGAK